LGWAPPSDAVSVRTFNWNFPGRSGTPSDQVYLTTPTVAAATALYGVITDPRELGEYPDLPEAPMNPAVDDSQILAPAPEDEADKIEIQRGPNIHEPPEAEELPEDFTGTVIIVLPDDISTGDLSPDGVEVMAFRSNIPELASYTLRRFDPEFPEKAQEWAPGVIVGGENYGQGSSREHAALAPLYLGIRAVIAKSFPRIHRRNLVSQGIAPLRFKNEEDYDKFEPGQEVTLSNIREHLENGDTELTAQVDGTEMTLLAEFSDRERNLLLHGGFRRQLRQQQEEESAAEAPGSKTEPADRGEETTA
jgi:aconitate hydratase